MAIALFSLARRDFAAAPKNVAALALRVMQVPRIIVFYNDAAAANVQIIDNDKTSCRDNLRDGIKGNGLSRTNKQFANFMTPADLMPLRTIYFAAAPSRRWVERVRVRKSCR